MNDHSDIFSAGITRLAAARSASAPEFWARELIEAAPDAVVVIDRSGRIVLVNAQTERLFGYARQELLGQAIEILVPERLREAHVGRRDAFIGSPSVRPMGVALDLSARCRDGHEIPVEISLSPLHTADGVLISAAIRDITERRRTQEALRQARDELELRVRERTAELEQANGALQAEMADRAKAEGALRQAQKMEAVGQLTGGVAHDFNNLLTVIMGNLQILAAHLRDDAFAAELVQVALKAAKRGSDLNRTLLAFSRKQRLAPTAVDFNEMIGSMSGMLRRVLGEPVSIGQALAAGLPLAIADPSQLETALLNLAVNARDAMPEGGVLTIETGSVILDEHYAASEVDVKPGRYVLLAVSDTGYGMPPEVVARACEPFFTTKEVGKGSGLGLAMVYGFVKQSGGHVKIYSEPGFGTTVKLFFPELATPTPAGGPEPTAVAAASPRGNETLLVVEDEQDVRQLACRVLSGLGYRILQAGDGRAALALLETEPAIDLLFTDVVLPGGMNGPEIARRALLRRPALKVLYTSGYTGNAIQQLDALATPVRLITKPYPIEELAQVVRALLDGGA
jgi:PAS domain S-box-containing protein